MSRQRIQSNVAFKSKVVLEAIKGLRTANGIATHYGGASNVAHWKEAKQDHLQERHDCWAKEKRRLIEAEDPQLSSDP